MKRADGSNYEGKPEIGYTQKAICIKEAEGSLLKTGKIWLFGSNIPGRKPAVTFAFLV